MNENDMQLALILCVVVIVMFGWIDMRSWRGLTANYHGLRKEVRMLHENKCDANDLEAAAIYLRWSIKKIETSGIDLDKKDQETLHYIQLLFDKIQRDQAAIDKDSSR